MLVEGWFPQLLNGGAKDQIGIEVYVLHIYSSVAPYGGFLPLLVYHQIDCEMQVNGQ